MTTIDEKRINKDLAYFFDRILGEVNRTTKIQMDQDTEIFNLMVQILEKSNYIKMNEPYEVSKFKAIMDEFYENKLDNYSKLIDYIRYNITSQLNPWKNPIKNIGTVSELESKFKKVSKSLISKIGVVPKVNKSPKAERKLSPKKTSKNMIGPVDDPERYNIIGNISEGAYGQQKIGIDRNGKKFAIKFFKTVPKDNIYAKESYEIEVECLKASQKVCGDLIICIHDHFITPKNEYILVTPYLEGYTTIYDFIMDTRNRISKSEYEHIIKQIKRAKEKLNIVGLFHGDLNPRNILIDPNTLKIKIIDLGLCGPLQKEKSLGIYSDVNRIKWLEMNLPNLIR